MAHREEYILRSEAQTGSLVLSRAALAQSNWQVQRGKLSGPNSQVASKSQWMSRQASRSTAVASDPADLGEAVSMLEPVSKLDIVAVGGRVAKLGN